MFSRVGLACCFVLGASCPVAMAGSPDVDDLPGIRVYVQSNSYHNPLGQPVWVYFRVENTTGEAISLTVPGKELTIPSPEVGLPISHIFSGASELAVSLSTESGQRAGAPLGYRQPREAPILLLAPHSTVSTAVDLREYFPVLRGAGRYRLVWKPYGGAVESQPIVVHIAPLKQAEIVTDEGKMTLRFRYKEAPRSVANFIELAESDFYNGLTFHRIAVGYLIQGGCPRGDGTGIRLDGKRVPVETNNLKHHKGTVSMALLDDDPESASCQFFIANTRNKEWDGKYTVFAELADEESYATLDRLLATGVNEFSRPLHTLYLRSVRIVDAPSDLYRSNLLGKRHLPGSSP